MLYRSQKKLSIVHLKKTFWTAVSFLFNIVPKRLLFKTNKVYVSEQEQMETLAIASFFVAQNRHKFFLTFTTRVTVVSLSIEVP